MLLLTILLRVEVLDPLSETGSSEASGDVPGDVDIGEPEVGCSPNTWLETSRRSRNGFLLLFEYENGLDRPMVANLWPLLSTFDVLMKGLVKGLVVGFIMERASENSVSFCNPANPFWEKWVMLTGRWEGFSGADRFESGVSGEVSVEVGVRLDVKVRLFTPDPRAGLGTMGVERAERSSRLEGWVETGRTESRSIKFVL